METTNKNQDRIYKISDCCIFRKTNEEFGGLSNMASGYFLKINGINILTSEALYQACRFPHLPDVQKKIIEQKSPMSAKMVGKPFRNNSRPDWYKVRVEIMYWCLRVKLAQNFVTFGRLLETTGDKPIVEDSAKDKFWGAIKDKQNDNHLIGVNALGRLLMKLRQEYNSEKRFDLLFVEPLTIPNFIFYHNQIQEIDERQNFLNALANRWKNQNYSGTRIEVRQFNLSEHDILEPYKVDETDINLTIDKQETKQVKEAIKKGKASDSGAIQQDLFSD
ncbi:MAG: NADAR family protein [Bacteroidales bacterium]|nr:NADAR family protein [Bacteroidales bacterium]